MRLHFRSSADIFARQYQNMGRRRFATYYNKGFMMSRRARLAVSHNEHPIKFWTERFVMDEELVEQLLIFMGNHHVGSNCVLTPFYRLPDKDDPGELMRIYKAFHLIPARKLNFIRIMSMHLQKAIDEKGKVTPVSERPRKKRNRYSRRKKRGKRKKNKVLQRTIW